MRDKKIIPLSKYVSKKNSIEIERKELLDLIRKVINTIKKENAL